jgi:predicted Zn-dependent peptidase
MIRSQRTLTRALAHSLSVIGLVFSAGFAACNNGSTNTVVQNNGTSGSTATSVDAGVLGVVVGPNAGQIVVTDPIPTDADLDPPVPTVAQTPEVIPMPPARTTPDARFRRREPGAARTAPFVTPQVAQFMLPNGMQVFVVEQHQMPIVYAQYVTRHAADDVAPAQSGLAWMTSELLEQGTTRRNAEALSDAYAAIGAEHDTGVDWDSAGVSIKVLAPRFGQALDLLAEQVQQPAFSQTEIDRLRTRRLANLRAERDSPPAVASMLTARLLYGDEHPYSRPVAGFEQSIRAISRQQIQEFYQSHYVPADSALVVTGDITVEQLRPLVERTFGQWHGAAGTTATSTQAPLRAGPPAVTAGPPRVWLVDRPHAAQSSIVLSMPGAARSDPNFAKLEVANTILGGMFSSRINMNLREAHAYTYGARSRISFRRGVGPFSAGGAMITRHTANAAQEILNEVRRMRERNVTAEELRTAQTKLIEAMRANFASVEGTAALVSNLFVYGLPLSQLTDYPASVQRVTRQDVRAMSQRWDTARLNLVVVGDRAAIEEGLVALRRGAIELRDPDGNPVIPAPTPTSTPTTASAATTASTADAGAATPPPSSP